jgi:hypothetical protein
MRQCGPIQQQQQEQEQEQEQEQQQQQIKQNASGGDAGA